MTYADTTVVLADATEQKVRDLHDAWMAGDLAADEWLALTVAAILAACHRAVGLADAALAAALTVLAGKPVPALGLTVPADTEPRLRAAITMVARLDPSNPDDVEVARRIMRAARIAKAEPLAAGRTAYAEGMRRRKVPGWTRATNGDACELCRSLADGTVLAPDTVMIDHPGCGCVPRPVLSTTTQETTT